VEQKGTVMVDSPLVAKDGITGGVEISVSIEKRFSKMESFR